MIENGYDDTNRLTSLTHKETDHAVLASYQFPVLDGNGNRIADVQQEPLAPLPDISNRAYTYNDKKNRLTSAGTSKFSYNDEGEIATGYGSAYSFDHEHRLTGISNQQTVFSYDGSGNRLKAVRSGVETRYIYDAGGNLLAEADANNVITKYYIYGAGLMAMVTPSDQVYTYHFNAIGSTVAMTDASQNIVNKYAYDPFGNIIGQQETISQPFKFVGQFGVMSEPNGFYYMKARYYDPKVGRFISEDPIAFEGGDVNLMAYVGNNPVMLIDPDGNIAFAPLLYFAGAKVGAVATAYVGTNISQWMGNSLAGSDAVSNQVVNQVFAKVAAASAVSAFVPAAKIGAAAGGVGAVKAATTAVIMNPQAVQRAADFAGGWLTEMGPPPPTPAGYAGALAHGAYDYIQKNISNTQGRPPKP